ncbi:adenosine-specific kinase [bacterium]|nr:adenosine-specific kinase [bacterium]
MKTLVVPVKNPEGLNFILGQSHFIKTVEDMHEALIQTVPGIQFGMAFCEASGPRLIRYSGTDDEMTGLAKSNIQDIGAGHVFIVFLKNAFPINVLPVLRQIPEICRIFCATANPAEIVVAETDLGRGVLGVIDGQPPLGFENDEDIQKRKDFLRQIGYKL